MTNAVLTGKRRTKLPCRVTSTSCKALTRCCRTSFFSHQISGIEFLFLGAGRTVATPEHTGTVRALLPGDSFALVIFNYLLRRESFVGSTHIDHWPQSFCSLTFRLLSRSRPSSAPPPQPRVSSANLLCFAIDIDSLLDIPFSRLVGETLHCKPRLTQNVNYSPEGVSTTRSWRKQTSRGADGKTLRDETSRHWDGTQRLRVALWPVLQG